MASGVIKIDVENLDEVKKMFNKMKKIIKCGYIHGNHKDFICTKCGFKWNDWHKQ